MDLRKNLQTDRVGQLQAAEALCVQPGDTIAAALALMRQNPGAGCVLVCDRKRLVGIFTERDVLRIIAQGGDLAEPVSSVMTAQPATIRADATVGQAVLQMHRGGYRRLPVVSAGGEPTGVIQTKNVVHYLVEHFPSSVYNLPPVPQATARDREGA
ncbi:MAG: CBS domain-containing protein [Planctomycetes bacterium]|nr:CBS domain-containing protein [Planctomycetota bacterium]